MSNEIPLESFVPLSRAAARLGVPAAWLRDELLAGRVPHLRAGRRLLINIETAERVLMMRAERQTDGGDHG